MWCRQPGLDYEACSELYARRRQGLGTKKIANNTYLFRHEKDDAYVVRLHGSPILCFYPGRKVKLDPCGWMTSLTQDRLNYALGVSVYTLDGDWYVTTNLHEGPQGRGRMNRPVFYSGMVIHQVSGEITTGVKFHRAQRLTHPQGHQVGVWTPPVWEEAEPRLIS